MSVKPIGRCTQIRLPETVVPREAFHRLVTANLHDGERVNSRPAHIGNRRMPEVVEVETLDTCAEWIGRH